MPLSKTTTFSFNSSSLFNKSLPSYVLINSEKAKTYVGRRFATISKDLYLTDTNHGYLTFDITYTGTANIAAITFSTPNNSDISVSTDLNDIFAYYIAGIPPNGYDIKLTSGQTKRIYVIVNGYDLKTSSITIHTAVGSTPSKLSLAVGSSIVCEYDCYTPLYKYDAGLHVYSPYDAANSPKLTTNLCASSPTSSWTTNTKVWADPYFSFPAYPYYYGIGNKVYKVGNELDRAYGTKKRIRIYKSAWMNITGKPAQITETTLGPQKWNGTISDSTNGCVEVLSSGIGRIKEIINTGTLIQPQKYKYFMGYNASNAETANNSAFQKFVLTQEKFYPVTGDAHAMY